MLHLSFLKATLSLTHCLLLLYVPQVWRHSQHSVIRNASKPEHPYLWIPLSAAHGFWHTRHWLLRFRVEWRRRYELFLTLNRREFGEVGAWGASALGHNLLEAGFQMQTKLNRILKGSRGCFLIFLYCIYVPPFSPSCSGWCTWYLSLIQPLTTTL